jgi:shikimate kinase
MRVFITGVACVGKTTIGSILASRLGCRFFDLDLETEKFFGESIERLQDKTLTWYSFSVEGAKALQHVLSLPDSRDCVIALPPGGLRGGYLRVLKKTAGIIVVLTDMPQNILDRITFYDIDSRLIEKRLTDKEKKHYLRDIRTDMNFYRTSYARADVQVDISGLTPEEAAEKVQRSIEAVAPRAGAM